MGDPKTAGESAPVEQQQSPPRSVDPAALEMLRVADDQGIATAFSPARSELMPCPIGGSGSCCRICSMGPVPDRRHRRG